MKTSAIILIVVVIVLRDAHCHKDRAPKPKSKRLGDRINLFSAKEKVIGAFAHVHSRVGVVLINMSRMMNYIGLRLHSWAMNSDFVLNQKDAAYFFHEEQFGRDQKIAFMKQALELRQRKRDEVRGSIWNWNYIYPWNWGKAIPVLLQGFWKVIQLIRLNTKIGKLEDEFKAAQELYNTEEFCEGAKSLDHVCKRAFRNEKLQQRISLTFNSKDANGPRCEMKPVYLPDNQFSSERKFLVCPVIAYKQPYHEKQFETYAYISSVANPSKYRLRYYLFMSPGSDLSVEPPLPPPPPPYAPNPSNSTYPFYPPPYYPRPNGAQNPAYPGYPPTTDPSYPPRESEKNYQAPYSWPPHPPYYQPPNSNVPHPTKGSAPEPEKPSSPPDPRYHQPQNPNGLYPTVESPPPSPPHNGQPSSSPPTFEGVRSRSPSPTSEQEPSYKKDGRVWFSNGKKSAKNFEKAVEGKSERSRSPGPTEQKGSKKGGRSWFPIRSKAEERPPEPLVIVTLVINRDFRAWKEEV